jgi:hypothetical protein
MKGLFCCFPSEYLSHFSVYGIKDQLLSSKHPTLRSSALSQFVDSSSRTVLKEKEIFQSSWLFAKGAGSTSSLLPLSLDYLQIHQQSGQYARNHSNLEKQRLKRPIFRFSKYSLLSSLNSYTNEQIENGIFLSLCRVLIIKQKNISSLISEQEIEEAVSQGYDALFSTIK